MAKRRGNGEGSIFERADGRWSGALTLSDGKRRTVYGRTRRDALAKLQSAQRTVAAGLPLAPERLTVGDLLGRWLEEVAKPSLRPRVYASYRGIVSGHLIPSLGSARLARLSPDQVQAYLNAKSESGLSPNTVRNHRAVLRRALNQAERWGLLARNVARLVTPPRVVREEVHPLNVEGARAVLDALEGHRLEAAFHLAVGLGMRQGEILGLTWGAVDLDLRTVQVERSLQRYAGDYHLDEVKTTRSRRRLGMPRELIDLLRTRRLRQMEERLQAGSAWMGNPWDLVFTTEFGTPVDGKHLRRALHRTLDSLGLPEQRFHDLRHAAASFMLAEGVALRVAQEVLGHSTIAVTADIYSHLAPAATYEATERVAALLRRESSSTAVKTAVNDGGDALLAPAARSV